MCGGASGSRCDWLAEAKSVTCLEEAEAKTAHPHPRSQVSMALLPLVLLFPLYCYRKQHPINLALLGAWTLTLASGVGVACTAFNSAVVLEALALTAGITLALTAYTFWAVSASSLPLLAIQWNQINLFLLQVKNGKDFDFMGPALFAGLTGLVLWGFFALFFPVGPFGRQLYALIGAGLFSAYIVFDTFLIIKRFDIDDYIWASVNLYLDIVQLFLKLLELLGRNRD